MTTTMPKRTATGAGSPERFAPEWQNLCRDYDRLVRSIAVYRVGPMLADDVVQEVFLRAHRNRHSFDPSQSLEGWLKVITARACIDVIRRRTATIEVSLGDRYEQAVADTSEDEFFNAVRRMGIEEAMAGLNQRHRRVLRLVEFEGWSLEQVAAAEGVSTQAAKSLLVRARQAFKVSYTAIAQRTDVWGAGAVGTTVWRIRTRIQQAVDNHAGTVGAAAVTVAVLAVAAVPATKPLPSSAIESGAATRDLAPRTSAGQQPRAVQEPATDGARSGTTSPGPQAGNTTPIATQPSVEEPKDTTVSVGADAGRNGDGAAAQVTAGTDGPEGDQRTFVVLEVEDCSTKFTTTATCTAIDVVSDSED